ncbi:pirin family protein [Arthrobacter sp. NEB 688]|uniref:pirin family protein n=1 Tax=Arthrobacter sp. NEB 688 TaxID=904039 RepID=UPI0015653828|nr:pirin family protein [Arthrobacter sp. NEB 688]QKE82899.1 hypothetical protein HL663_02315 [Arthrobacter sp. NEB 688]
MSTNAELVGPHPRSAGAPAGMVGTQLVSGGRMADGRPSGPLFYWSDTHFTRDFEFGLHPHQGFEIMSVVLEGTTRHYDTATQEWAGLATGDLEVMATGSGISHVEQAAAGTRVFSIWFDPDLTTALTEPPRYTLAAGAAAVTGGADPAPTIADLVGGRAPVDPRTGGLAVQRLTVPGGRRGEIALGAGRRGVAYVLGGHGSVNDLEVHGGDVLDTGTDEVVTVGGREATDVFVVSFPASTPYTPLRSQ